MMSDVETNEQSSPIGKVLTSSASARPFVLGQGNGGGQTLASSSSAVYAAPFVPASPGNPAGTRQNILNRGANGTSTQLSSRTASAAPFIPGGSQSGQLGPSAGRAAAMSSSAMPFVPRNSTDSFPSPRGRLSTNGSMGHHSELQLPDGDDLLGMTAHTPSGAPMARSPAKVLSIPVPRSPSGNLPAPQASLRAHRSSSPLRTSHNQGPGQGRGRGAPQAWRGGAQVGRGRTAPGTAGRGGRRPMQAAMMQGVQPVVSPYTMELNNAASAAGYWADHLSNDEQQRSYLAMQQGEEEWGLPETVQQYHSLYPLEDLSLTREKSSQAFGMKTTLMKGVSSRDGRAYTLRRLDNRRLPADPDLAAAAQDIVQQWSPLARHPNLSTPTEAFITGQMEGGPALVFVHAYYPAAITLEQAHMHQAAGGGHGQPAEEVLWCYMAQLTCAARAAHSAGLLLQPQSLAPSKVILTSPRRVRVGSLGVADLMSEEISSHEELNALQRKDLTAIGRLLLMLGCCCTAPTMDALAATYSEGLVRAVSALLASVQGTSFSSWQQVASMIAEHMMAEVEAQQLASDAAAAQVWKGAEDGRLLRILVKLTSILERPEHTGEPQWAETGDLYLLKLYRDFVLHQRRDDGSPNLDWGHVVESLNKLDAGIPEKVTLMSRDETSMLVMSYGDLKNCLDNVLKTQSSGPRAAPRLDMGRRL
ncbi:hypothetical protein CVIRNUC_004116 [Coccomyxa viridis]|uniref:Pan3 C-terminal knob domain-containing protein n=1 Tax=Coccomyxa viridis TaxID=1274662 RepID=A0AAV1I251_9CHLO|nr:hypothetical protein CVIRNUC_004116 [Coccomyxa viridis]